MNRWLKASMLEKRLSGCLSYLLAAVASLINPVAVDKAMLKVLQEQFAPTK